MRAVMILLMLMLAGPITAQTNGGLPSGTTLTTAFDQQQIEFLPVEQAYQVGIDLSGAKYGQTHIPDQRPVIRLFWQIADGYYLYRHQFKFQLQDAGGNPLELTAEYPSGIQRTDEYFGDVEVYYHGLDINLVMGQVPTQSELTVTSQGCADAGLCYPPRKQQFRINFQTGVVSPVETPRRQASRATPTSSTASQSLWLIILLTLAGGSILNLMPCVFPVLSLKVLGFAATPAHNRHQQSWLYTAGVVSSFVLIAALLISLQRAGLAVGWGFQLQSPQFVTALAYLFLVMALSLSGLFELGGRWTGIGDSLTRKTGLSGSFFTGVLATLVASPCTAPFMGTAVGFAATQPPPVALLVFFSLGFGMAMPMLLISYLPTLAQYMPKPGPWMETFKQVMAFPLYATAIWLIWVAGRQTSVNTMAITLAGALLLTLGLWLWRFRGWPRALSLATFVVAVLVIVQTRETTATASLPLDGDKVMWSQRALEQHLAQGQAVFVDVTADWCITCIANEQAVLETTEIKEAFERHGVTYMVADWTNYDSEIANFLHQYQRNGIPFYILFSGKPGTQPQVLPQLLSKSTVMTALQAL